jgi:hypothetical protein
MFLVEIGQVFPQPLYTASQEWLSLVELAQERIY